MKGNIVRLRFEHPKLKKYRSILFKIKEAKATLKTSSPKENFIVGKVCCQSANS